MKALTAGQKISSKLAVATFVSVLLLILVGATVRITGAGMGCPDWPTCFGRIIPPTNISQLPANYKEIYAKPGYEKVADFNPMHTWIEYGNRLFSAVIIGPIAIAFAISSFAWWKRDRTIVMYAFIILILIGFEAWLGKEVVASNLKSTKITTHLIMAMVILTLSLFAAQKTMKASNHSAVKALPKHFSAPLYMSFVLLICQILLGTYVRGEVDSIADINGEAARNSWILGANTFFPIHKIVTYAVVASYIWLTVKMLQQREEFKTWIFTGFTIGLAGQLFTAFFLVYFGYPAVAQLLHLTFAMVLFSCHIYLMGRHWLAAKTATEEIGLKKINFA
ncbi:MAG: COX15/CtaA family protein [Bacteroidia bacterium]